MNVYRVVNKYDGKTAGQLFLIEMAKAVVLSGLYTSLIIFTFAL